MGEKRFLQILTSISSLFPDKFLSEFFISIPHPFFVIGVTNAPKSIAMVKGGEAHRRYILGACHKGRNAVGV